MRQERPLSHVPIAVWLVFVTGLALQVAVQAWQPPPPVRIATLPEAPDAATLRALALGDPVALAKVTMLWLQSFDEQPGVSLRLRDLDYERLVAWLDRLLTLDPLGQYPLLAATRLYAEAGTPDQTRTMLAFVYRRFSEDPERRWPWLAHAVLLAQHRLHDRSLALRYAEALADLPASAVVPDWARQMRIFILEDMGEIESARALLGALIAGGTLTDPHERDFLARRLQALDTAAEPAPRR